MKKYFMLVVGLSLFLTQMNVKAEEGGGTSNAISRMTGVDPNIKNTSKPTPTPTPVPTPTPALNYSNLDKKLVQKNQQRDTFIAMGMLLFNNKRYEAASSEFRKANAISTDKVSKRWYEVTENRKKIIQLEDLISKILKTNKEKSKD